MAQIHLPKREMAVVFFLAGYAIISGVCFFGSSTPVLREIFERNWGLLWLLGPPATLVWEWGYTVPYIAGTVLILLFGWGLLSAIEKLSDFAWLLALFAIATWVAFGFLAYAPSV
jgi:hypothetical protein